MKNGKPESSGLVVLLHGVLRSKTDMLPLSRFLKKQGYDTANILYPSRLMDLEGLTAFVAEKVRHHPDYSPDKPLHFVVHSMGGLITRYYIDRHKPQNLGRVIMLSPPNTGSELADILNENPLTGPAFRKTFGPAALQLTTRYHHTDSPVDYPLGIIAGTRSINPLSPFLIPKEKVGPHDGIVPVERTKIEGMTDHIVMPVTHTFMMFNPAVMHQVFFFLKNGQFERPL